MRWRMTISTAGTSPAGSGEAVFAILEHEAMPPGDASVTCGTACLSREKEADGYQPRILGHHPASN